MLKVPNGLKEIISTFGNIEQYIKDDGLITHNEEMEFLSYYTPPFIMKYAYANINIKTIRCHKLLLEPIGEVFDKLLEKNLYKNLEYGGCYNYRPKRSSIKLSTHSWGIAIDINPRTNMYGTSGDLDPEIIKIFKDVGFIWGGNWSKPDPMHFQYAKNY